MDFAGAYLQAKTGSEVGLKSISEAPAAAIESLIPALGRRGRIAGRFGLAITGREGSLRDRFESDLRSAQH